MVLFNPGGHDWGNFNLDGYGIGYIVWAIAYTAVFLIACAYVWMNREAPAVRMRNIPLAVTSLLILHVYIFMVWLVYPLNGAFPCQAEFWIMSIYLPIGIGLFQAQNQQLLIVSKEQNQLPSDHDKFKPMLPKGGSGSGTVRYWVFRTKLWWKAISQTRRYEFWVYVGVAVQAIISMILYLISKNFNRFGVVGHAAANVGLCRRGWEWIPSIAWQCLWNYFFGPYLLWKIRMIRDIYHWRLQTTMAIVAGLPGTPLWLIGVYSDSMAGVNKYWVPAMWFVPGIMIMEITTLAFPIYQILKHKKLAAQLHEELKEFEARRQGGKVSDSTAASLMTRSTASKGRMFSMGDLESELNGNHDGLQVYASCVELAGENILFLRKVIGFKRHWANVFTSKGINATRARMTMYRSALSIYISLVDANTASYAINVESPVYMRLQELFGEATALVACHRRGSTTSTCTSSAVTPWDEPEFDPMDNANSKRDTIHMKTITWHDLNDSTEAIVNTTELNTQLNDPLAAFLMPQEFNAHCFDEAFKSIKYMVWSETWQRYMNWKKLSGHMTD